MLCFVYTFRNGETGRGEAEIFALATKKHHTLPLFIPHVKYKNFKQQKKYRNVFHPSPLFSILTYFLKQQKNRDYLRKKTRNYALPPHYHIMPW
jgi:hypothetical protein